MLSEKQILEKKQYGDIQVIAKVLSNKAGKYISTTYTTQILSRPESKHYKNAIEALRQIVEHREQLIQESLLEPHS
jgi:hypothetical protein